VLGRASADSSMCSAFLDREPLAAPSAHEPDSVPSPAKVAPSPASNMEWEEGHTYGYLVVVRESGVEGSSFPIMDDVTIGRQAYLLARMIGHTKPTSTAFPCPTRLPATS
jgi:hypothetical protein